MPEMSAYSQKRKSTRLFSASSDGSGGFSPTSIRVLIVEDDYFVAAALEYNLIEAGLEVVGIAATAEEAVELAISGKPTLAIMDIRLAGKRDGVDAAIELLSKHAVPSIFATAHSDPDTRKRAEDAKPLAWLTKPYSPEAVVKAIKDVLQERPN